MNDCLPPSNDTALLLLLADIRAAVGDAEGRLMQDELVEHCRKLKAAADKLEHGLFKIRPFKWEAEITDYYQIYRVNVPMGDYSVERIKEDYDESKPWEGWKMRYSCAEYYDEGEEEVASLADGKAKAWQDWLGRITPALNAVKPPSKCPPTPQ